MLILHLVLPLAPKHSPDTPTMCGMLDVFRSLSFSFLYISKDMTLFMAPVLKSVLILTSKLLFAKICYTVPVVGPNLSML